MLYESRLISALQNIDNTFTYILADRNGVEPAAPYVLVSIINLDKVGMSERSYISSTNVETLKQTMQVTYRITLHALATDTKQDDFETLHVGFESSNQIFKLFDQGLSLINVGSLMYISTPIDTVMYKRAVFDLVCLVERSDDFYADRVSSVSTTGNLTDSENNSATFDVTSSYPPTP